MFEEGKGIKQQILFKVPDQSNAEQLQREIERLVKNHEPRVTLGTVLVNPEPQNNRWTVDIVFAIVNTIEPLSIENVFIERIR
jgi:predicted component of type VI protein secretion system